jgi:hypothetical protein
LNLDKGGLFGKILKRIIDRIGQEKELMLSHVITAAISSGVGATARRPQIDRLTENLQDAYCRVRTLHLQLQEANSTIQDQATELDRRARSEASKDAEIAGLRELLPPEDTSK